jgi:hypothetical protein
MAADRQSLAILKTSADPREAKLAIAPAARGGLLGRTCRNDAGLGDRLKADGFDFLCAMFFILTTSFVVPARASPTFLQSTDGSF